MSISRTSLTVLVLSLLVFASSFLSKQVFSAFNNIVINELQINGAVPEDEFVELYNPTASAIDITGWRLTRHTESGASESNLVASLSGIVPAGGYFLVANDDFGGPTPDQLYSALSNNIASNNSITLYSDAGVTVVDRVGLGSATLFEGSAFPSNPPSGNSIQRIQDTENNANDFVLLESPTPTKSTATPTPTLAPTVIPTSSPSQTPSPSPTVTATATPTTSPSPTTIPTLSPTPSPTQVPSLEFPLTVFRGRIFTVTCSIRVMGFGNFRLLVPQCVRVQN